MKLQKQRAARVLLVTLGSLAVALIVIVALSSTPPPALTAPAGYYVRHVPLPERLPSVAPESVGMSAERLNEIDTLVARGIAAGGFPGAAVVIGRKGGQVMATGFGHTGWSPGAAVVSADSTEYDLASLTKVVATTSAIMALYDDDVISLDDPVAKWVPSFTGGAKDRVTIRDLLTHRSGLPPGRELWKFMGDRSAAKRAVISTSLVAGCPPGRCYMYSDLGADMLGFVAEAAAHEPLDHFTERRVFGPLGMSETTFHPNSSEIMHLAPTGAPRGRVHDANSAALGGVAGHAGLFSTASDLAVFAQMLLDGGEYDGTRIFREATVALFTKRTAGTRALGWDTCDSANVRSTCGRYLSARAFGHTGFTGTSMWIDPDREMFTILLTNRVDDPRVRRPERVIHDIRSDLADAAVLSVIDAEAGTLGLLASSPGFRSDHRQRWQEPVSVRRAKAKASAKKHRAKNGSRVTRPSRSRARRSTARTRSRRHS
ncbi:MAG: serine hydrolase domain-containing protein [Gemmatimonadaceae bacterium]